jgi:HEAT repeat protein
MSTFEEKLNNVRTGGSPTAASLTFLSDLGMEDRTTFRRLWPEVPVERRRRIVAMLATMAEENIELYFRPVFLVALEDSDPQVRLSSIEGLFEDESKVLLSRLIEVLRRDPDDDVREAAASALGRFTYLSQCDKLGADAPKLRDALLQAANDLDEKMNVRRRAIEALGYLNGDTEVQELIADAYSRGGRQAESAVFAMGRNMDARWERTVLDELESDLAPMRYEAARAAGEMGLEDALPYLSRLIDDKDMEVKLASVWALGQIGGKPAAEALIRAMKSDEPAVREAAEEAMQEIAFSANPLNVL